MARREWDYAGYVGGRIGKFRAGDRGRTKSEFFRNTEPAGFGGSVG